MRWFKILFLLMATCLLGLTLDTIRAEAAEATFDTPTGEMSVVEDGYEKYIAYGDFENSVVVFYNGDLYDKNFSNGERKLTATGESKVYSPINNYEPLELSAKADLIPNALGGEDLPYFNDEVALQIGGNAALKSEAEQADGTMSGVWYSVPGFVTKRQLQTATQQALSTVDFDEDNEIYFVMSNMKERYIYVGPESSIDVDNTKLFSYDTGLTTLVKDSTEWQTAFSSLGTIYADADLARKSLIFASKDINITGADGVVSVVSSIHGDARTAAFGNLSNTTSLEVAIEPTIINVVVPLTVNAVIDVNQEDALIYGDIVIKNNTKAPVKISLSKFTSPDLPFTNLIRPSELPVGLDWNLLDATNSMKYFSFGMKPIDTVNTPWRTKVSDYAWAAPSFVASEMGVITGSSSSNLGLDARFGRVVTGNSSFTFQATFVAELE